MTDKMREAFEKEWTDYMKKLPSQTRWMFGQYYAEIKEFVAKHFWQAAYKEGVSEMQHTVDSFNRRIDLLEKAQRFMSEPSRTIVCDILANGALLPDSEGKRYGIDLRVAIQQLQEQDNG